MFGLGRHYKASREEARRLEETLREEIQSLRRKIAEDREKEETERREAAKGAEEAAHGRLGELRDELHRELKKQAEEACCSVMPCLYVFLISALHNCLIMAPRCPSSVSSCLCLLLAISPVYMSTIILAVSHPR